MSSLLSTTTMTPYSVMRVAVTYLCNLKCGACYAPVVGQRSTARDEIDISLIVGFIDKISKNPGLERITITGGEPLLKIVWGRTKSMLDCAHRNRLGVMLNTGGKAQILPIQAAESFDDSTIDQLLVQFSLDGTTEKTVDEARGCNGVFISAKEHMQATVKAGLNTQIRATATKLNLSEMLDLYRFSADLGIGTFKIMAMFASGNALEQSETSLEYDEVVALQEGLMELSLQEGFPRLAIPAPVLVDPKFFSHYPNFFPGGCDCGVRSGYVAPNGDFFSCPHVVGDPNVNDFMLGNIVDEDFDLTSAFASSILKGCGQPDDCPSVRMLSERNLGVTHYAN